MTKPHPNVEKAPVGPRYPNKPMLRTGRREQERRNNVCMTSTWAYTCSSRVNWNRRRNLEPIKLRSSHAAARFINASLRLYLRSRRPYGLCTGARRRTETTTWLTKTPLPEAVERRLSPFFCADQLATPNPVLAKTLVGLQSRSCAKEVAFGRKSRVASSARWSRRSPGNN